MDNTYENYELTIIALHGENDQSRLAGLRSTLTSSQPCLETRNGCFMSSLPPISTFVAKSKWKTRGCIYQKARLSRRCLFFTECLAYLHVESLHGRKRFRTIVPQVLWLSFRTHYDSTIQCLTIADGFVRDRWQYSKQHLTHEDDMLNAFSGILSPSTVRTSWVSE